MPWLIALAAITTGFTVFGQIQAAKAEEIELKKQAETEKLAAEGRELSRRQRLNKVLAANVVGQVTAGITGEGTPASISLASARQASISEGLESLSDRLRRAQLKRQARSTRQTGRLAAASTLLKSGIQIASLG